jgi:hypothetical protein
MTSDNKTGIEQEWRQQPLGRQTMSLEEIRAKAKKFDMKVKRWSVVGGISVALLLVGNALEVWLGTDVLERSGDLLTLLALLYLVYRFRGYGRADAAPATLGLTSCVEHYRSRLMRERNLSRDSWKWVLLFVPGIGVNVLGSVLETPSTSHIVTLSAMGVAVFAGVLWVNARTARKLEREIAALD